MKKNTFLRIITGFIIAGILLTGCNNSVKDNEQTLTNGKTAYISVGSVEVGQSGRETAIVKNARTLLPEFDTEIIKDFIFTLAVMQPDGTQDILGAYESLSELKKASIGLEPGTYDITLVATKEGTYLKGTLEQVEIVQGPNSLVFVLEWQDNLLDETQTGSLEFTFDYSAATNASDVKCVTGELLKYDAEEEVEIPVTDIDENIDTKYAETKLLAEEGIVKYTLDEVPAGVYLMKIHLYADENKKVPLIAPYSEIAIITGGQTSTSSNSTETLNQVYTITFNGLEDAVVTDVPAKYTCVQETITLPIPQKLGYLFEGWYTKDDFSDTAVTKIEKGSMGNKTFYAKWNNDVSVSVVVSPVNDLELTAVPDETAKNVAFTVTGGVDGSYIWTVDGTKQEGETGSTFTLEATSLGTKTYVVEVVYGTRSATATAEIAWGDTYGTNKTLSLGDIVFKDGSAISYRENTPLTKMQAEAAVAVIFYVGTQLNDNGDTTTKRTLGLGLHNTCINNDGREPLAFAKRPQSDGETNIGWSTKIENIVCSIDTSNSPVSGNDPDKASEGWIYITDNLNGSDNWKEICQFDSTGTANASTYYPAFNWVNNYGTATGAAANLSGTDYESGWFLPSLAELCWLYRGISAANNGIKKINSAKAGTAELINNTDNGDNLYWSSSEPSDAASDSETNGEKAYCIDFYNDKIMTGSKNDWKHVCCIREF